MQTLLRLSPCQTREATERAAVEQALSASRAAYDGAADLEAALQASLSAQREAETSDLQSELDAPLYEEPRTTIWQGPSRCRPTRRRRGDADLAAAIDLRGRRRGGRRPPRAGAGGVDRGPHLVAPPPCLSQFHHVCSAPLNLFIYLFFKPLIGEERRAGGRRAGLERRALAQHRSS